MKCVAVGLVWIGLSFQAAFADFKKVVIPAGEEVVIGNNCAGADNRIQTANGQIRILEKTGESYRLNLDEQEGDLSVYLGSIGEPKKCVVAIQYAENEVNESFSLFIYDLILKKFKPSKIKIVNNPDFFADEILSEYKDGPLDRKDKVCYSEKISDYYFCEKKEQFSDVLERREVCNESSCGDPEIVRVEGGQAVEAVITASKVNFMERRGDFDFKEKKSYLLKGDKVLMVDYFRNGEGLYYKVIYMGGKKTQGWVSDKSVEY